MDRIDEMMGDINTNYIALATRTDLSDYNPVKERCQVTATLRLLHGAIGVSTEAGELLDIMKKHLMYGKPIDYVNTAEEVGDVMWYLALIGFELGYSNFDEILRININKLRARFGEKFSETAALERDLVKERELLETGSARADAAPFIAMIEESVKKFGTDPLFDKGVDEVCDVTAMYQMLVNLNDADRILSVLVEISKYTVKVSRFTTEEEVGGEYVSYLLESLVEKNENLFWEIRENDFHFVDEFH